MQQPIAPMPRSPTGLQRPIAALRAPTGAHAPISPSQPPADPGGEEWEDLPHLDSTMLAHPSGGGAGPAVPPVPARKPPTGRDAGDLPTIRPQDVPRKGGASRGREEPAERTFNEEERAVAPGTGEFEDLPTPVKNTPAVRDVGVPPEGEFAEDTNKGGLPRGMARPPAGGEASVELDDEDFESLD
jgi:hypothetical protein